MFSGYLQAGVYKGLNGVSGFAGWQWLFVRLKYTLWTIVGLFLANRGIDHGWDYQSPNLRCGILHLARSPREHQGVLLEREGELATQI